MSYCRWSSDDFQCDVYVYEDVMGGFTTHVAGMRKTLLKDQIPELVPFDQNNIEVWLGRENKVRELLEKIELKPIGLEHDGESFNDEDAESCAGRLIMLRDCGYNVPQYAIDALLEEANENEQIN